MRQNNTLFLAMVAGLFVEAFLLFDRWTGGGLLAFFGAGAVPVVYIVLISAYNKTSNEKLKKVMEFCFAGFLLFSAYIMGGIIGGFLGIILGIMLAGIIFAGTMAMVSKPKAGRSNSATRKKRELPRLAAANQNRARPKQPNPFAKTLTKGTRRAVVQGKAFLSKAASSMKTFGTFLADILEAIGVLEEKQEEVEEEVETEVEEIEEVAAPEARELSENLKELPEKGSKN